MGKRINHRYIAVLLALALIFLSLLFNSCSDVKFSPSAVDPGSQGPDEPNPPGRHTFVDAITISSGMNKTDILLVLDNSGSMSEDLQKLAERLDGLITVLQNSGIDWQMCYTTTHVDNNSSAGRILEWQKLNTSNQVVGTGLYVLQSTTPNNNQVFLTTLDNLPDSSSGSGNEQGIVAIGEAMQHSQNQSCFRQDAILTTLLISDEDEKSCGGRCQNAQATPNHSADTMREQYRALEEEDEPQFVLNIINSKWPNRPYVAHSIVIREDDLQCIATQDAANPAFEGIMYAELSRLTGGVIGDICADSYADQLTVMGERTGEIVRSISLRCAPVDTAQLTFTPAASGGLTWRQEGNKILFNQALPANTVVRVQYTCIY